MIVDTSVLLAYFDRNEPDHAACVRVVQAAEDDLVVSPYVMAELDYMVATRRGVEPELTALTELAGGAWELPVFTADDINAAARLIGRYRDQDVGLADASNVVLAARYRTRTIATLDHRHFEVLRPLTGGRFTVVP